MLMILEQSSSLKIKMRRLRKAKIIATLGPATSNPEAIKALFVAGVDVFRFNFSHGTHETHAANYQTVRQLESEFNRPIAILADLQGPKIRIGQFVNEQVSLAEGAKFQLDLDSKLGTQERVSLPHPEIFSALTTDSILLLDDGRLRLKVDSISHDCAITTVQVGGKLSNNKGVNVPDLILPVPTLTKKDLSDLDYALELGADLIALSFVQQPSDVITLREIVGDRAKIVAKIEKPSAIDHLEKIVDVSDAIMVARGDLGVEVSPERVPTIQKSIIRKCREYGKPVIVATQMLESMITAPIPTRAEAADVASAVYEGADAVMLSGESAVGKFPIETVEIMSKIITQVETDKFYQDGLDSSRPKAEPTTANAICCAMRRVVNLLPVSATVTYTSSGYSAIRAARERPKAPILSLSPNLHTSRFLSLVWGVHSVQSADPSDSEDIYEQAVSIAKREGMTQPEQPIVVLSGMPFGQAGTTNSLRLEWP